MNISPIFVSIKTASERWSLRNPCKWVVGNANGRVKMIFSVTSAAKLNKWWEYLSGVKLLRPSHMSDEYSRKQSCFWTEWKYLFLPYHCYWSSWQFTHNNNQFAVICGTTCARWRGQRQLLAPNKVNFHFWRLFCKTYIVHCTWRSVISDPNRHRPFEDWETAVKSTGTWLLNE